MSLMYWLRKLGILRIGTEAAVYHNAAERPASLQMDDVFDSRKDVCNFDKPAAGEVDSAESTSTAT